MFTWDNLIQIAVVLMACWGFYKVIKEMVEEVTKRHDKEQKWSDWEENLQKERDKIYDRYDSKLTEIEDHINSNHADTEAKLQETRSELFILTECMSAVLDGLKQLNCNGNVTEAKNNLDAYLIKRAHE